MRILITGITGMVGSHLADFLSEEHPEHELFGLIRWRSPQDNILQVRDKVSLELGDLNDMASLLRVLEKVRPDWIFHLAAQSFVTQSFWAPVDTLGTNILGTTNLLEAVRSLGLDPLIHVCSSSEVYGDVTEDEIPITESSPMRPASPYAVSKVGEDMIAMQYHLSHGLRTLRTRMFTHTGPRRGPVFAESSFAKQIAEIELGVASNPVRVGNLDSIRTIADVRDTVRAYWLLMEHGVPGEVYNIGGVEQMTIAEVLETLKGLAKVDIRHEIDPSLLRPSDVTLQIPSISKFQNLTGWRPRISAKQTLADLLDYYRARVRAETSQ